MSDIDSLRRQIETLEQQLAKFEQPQTARSWIKRAGLTLVTLLGLALGASLSTNWPPRVDGQIYPGMSTTAKELVCRELRLVDSAGKTRVHLGAPAEEGGFIKLLGKDGQPLAGLYEASSGGRMTLFNTAGKAVSSFGAGEHGGYMALADARGEPRFWQYVNDAGDGQLSMANADNQEIVGASALTGGGGLWVNGKDGRRRVLLGCDATDQSGLAWLYGEDATPRVALSSNAFGGSIDLYRQGQPAVSAITLGCTRAGGALEIDAANGNDSIWMRSREAGGGLSLYGADGKERAFLGTNLDGDAGALWLNHSADASLAYLGPASDGSGGLFKLFAPDGKMRVELGVDARGTGYGAGYDPNGRARRWMR